jgi:hypothetical protein
MHPTHDDIRTRFKAFVGEKRFRDFVYQIDGFANDRGRLRFWQEKVWEAFLVENPGCRMDHDELCRVFRTRFRSCELHRCELKRTPVRLLDGWVKYPTDFISERERWFPHATPEFLTTDGTLKLSEHRIAFACDKCDEILKETRWFGGAGQLLTVRPAQSHSGIARAVEVARSGNRSEVTEADAKLLGFFLRQGDCDARIAEPRIEVRFSWLDRITPSTYFAELAPGLISQLMDLGGVDSIEEMAEFTVGPGNAGLGIHSFSFARKWIWIKCAAEEIQIRVRDNRADFEVPVNGHLIAK